MAATAIRRPASRAAAVAGLCRSTAARTEDEALDGDETSGAKPAGPDSCPADALDTGTAVELPEEAGDSSFEGNRRPLESRSRLTRCKSVPISAACW